MSIRRQINVFVVDEKKVRSKNFSPQKEPMPLLQTHLKLLVLLIVGLLTQKK